MLTDTPALAYAGARVAGATRLVHRRALRATARLLLPSSILAVRGRGAGGRVALTFDDGPDTLTGAYLEVLARHRARATFFVLGEAAAGRPADIAAIAAAGHEIGVHGFSHRRFTEMTAAELVADLRRTRALLPAVPDRPLVRPPRGLLGAAALLTCARAGFRVVLWSLDSDDARVVDAAAVGRVAARVRSGDIVLLHEGQPWTLEALPSLLRGLDEAGFRAVTVTELLRA
jgi:peptidoglycan-N-acetylglucosamine deacetylase